MSSALSLDDVTAKRGAARVLHGVSLALAPGTVTVVLGENGAGKTTLLDVASGLLQPTSGRVRLGDVDLGELSVSDRARRVASLGAGAQGDPLWTVASRIGHGLIPTLGLGARDAEAVRVQATRLGVDDLLSRPLANLSVGQRRRVELARLFIHPAASVFIVDEPFAGLDPSGQTACVRAMRACAENGQAVLFAAHQKGPAFEAADEVVGLRDNGIAVGPLPPSAVADRTLLGLFGL